MKMIPIEDYRNFQQLYKKAKAEARVLGSNCLLPGKIIRDCIQQGNVSYKEFPEGIALYVEDDDLYRIYYFLDNSKPLPTLTCQKPVLIEEPDSGNHRKDYLNQFSKKLHEAGFYTVSHNYQYEIILSENKKWIQEEFEKETENIKSHGLIDITEFNQAQIEQILKIWKDLLKVTDVPTEHKTFYLDKKQHVVCVVNKTGDVCGTLLWVIRGNICEIRHIVTHPDYFRMGISKYTMLYSFIKAFEFGAKRVVSFVDVNNEKSVQMHHRMGMKTNGKISLQFLHEAE